MKDLSAALLAVFAGILTLALVSVIISRQSQTPSVIQAGASALANVIRAAVTPVAPAAESGTMSGNSFAPSGDTSSFLGGLFSNSIFGSLARAGQAKAATFGVK